MADRLPSRVSEESGRSRSQVSVSGILEDKSRETAFSESGLPHDFAGLTSELTVLYEPGDKFWSRQQPQCGPKP